MRTVWSRDALATCFPSALKATFSTFRSCLPRIRGSFDSLHQTRAVPSLDAVTILDPSELKATEPTCPSWPLNTIGDPTTTDFDPGAPAWLLCRRSSQTLAVRSWDPVTTFRP